MNPLRSLQGLWRNEALDRVMDAANKPVGSMHYDPWGYSREVSKLAFSLFRPVYDHYFRVSAEGLENIPQDGPCLVIANHSGQLPHDAALLGYAVGTNPHGARAPRAMMERFLPTIPFLGNLLNRVGAVVGDPLNCSKMLEAGELILVFPEGVRGTGKAFNRRYQLERFGHGFMHLAIEHKVPIVPVGIVGCEESILTVGYSKLLARLARIPYVPIALPVVLPTKVYMQIGKPMYFDAAENEDRIASQVESVKHTIAGLIHEGLSRRKGWF